MDIHCRTITPQDYASLPLLFEALGYPSTAIDIAKRMGYLMELPQNQALVALNDKEELIGFIGLGYMHYFERTGTYGAILAMAMRNDKQRQGVGTALIEAAEA
ncbi:GNAT family N-acetyltransferase [uncultured Marinococcus sp.]|uniref:GNAT family N-acetyltransferase n=1 Tax=uncultured Marinococcus sp. TaxID=487012 RepID=UPI0026059EB6|nr:GNAT family N-acetyltransferase [uncultured Marinococcus sp.]